jgi:uncharacterized protein (TIGR00645 family)
LAYRRRLGAVMINRHLRTFLFASRWLLAPLYVTLVLCLVSLLIKAGEKVVHFALAFTAQNESATIVAVLDLVDLTLTGSLIVLVIFSGYENFVSPADPRESRNWPAWMGTIDFAGLKLKLMSSLVAISAIRLLEAFMDMQHQSDRDLMWTVAVHLTFVISSLILALSDQVGGHDGSVTSAHPPDES